MSAVKVALGLASLVLGARHIKNGFASLSGGTPAAARRNNPPPRRGTFRVQGRPSTRSNGMTMTVHEAKSLDDRINFIRARIAKGKVDPKVYAFAREAVNKRCGNQWCIPEKDNLKEMAAVYAAVRNNVRYTSDILNVDTYQHPKNTLGLKSGDCDDYSSLLCSLMLTLGIPCRLKVIRTKDASEWNHIYAQGGLPRANPTRWYTLDASVPKPFGWEAPASMIAESRIFSVR